MLFGGVIVGLDPAWGFRSVGPHSHVGTVANSKEPLLLESSKA